MSVSDEDRTITDWRTESRLYRRKPGLGWILALVAIPVLLALIGLGALSGSKNDIDLAVPSVPASATLTVPSGPAMKGPAMTGPAMTGPARPRRAGARASRRSQSCGAATASRSRASFPTRT